MDARTIYIGEIFVNKKVQNKVRKKRLGYLPLVYIDSFDSFISLGRHEEFYIEKNHVPINERYIKEGTLIPYLSFGDVNSTNEEIINNIKIKINELVESRKIRKINPNLYEEKLIKAKYPNIDDAWLEKYFLVKNYYRHYKNVKILQTFKTLNGIEYDEKGYSLGIWLKKQKDKYVRKELSPEKYELLKSVGIQFGSNEEKWMRNYELARKYHGNLNIPENFITTDGYSYDAKGVQLGNWLKTQRDNYHHGKLSEERKEKLMKIDMVFENTKKVTGMNRWMKRYELARTYYEYHGNIDVPDNFKTNDGINYIEDGIKLEDWIKEQIYELRSNNLSKEKENLLNQIGITIKNENEDKWYKYYNLAYIYYHKHCNLKIRRDFKTLDGFTYSEDGILLGVWLNTQKCKYHKGELEDKKVELLKNIGMNFKSTKKSNINVLKVFKSILDEYDDASLPSKEEINDAMVRKLSK